MVHGGGRGVRGSLQGTVVCVMLIKDVADVTEETRRGELIHHCIIILPISVRVEGGGGERGSKGDGQASGKQIAHAQASQPLPSALTLLLPLVRADQPKLRLSPVFVAGQQ